MESISIRAMLGVRMDRLTSPKSRSKESAKFWTIKHKIKASAKATADGEPDDLRAEEMRMYAFAEAILIFDKAGNVIFEIDPELFK